MIDLQEMSVQQLKDFFEEAKQDLEKAAQEEPNSEWHEACFAGVMTIAFELQSRGVVNGTLH